MSLQATTTERRVCGITASVLLASLACACSLDWERQADGVQGSRPESVTALAEDGVLALQPRLWLSADRDVLTDDSDRVMTWSDQSGHAMNATAEEPEQRPKLKAGPGTRSLIYFDGDDQLALPALPPLAQLSFFAVASVDEDDRVCPSLLHFSNFVTPILQAHDIEFGRHDRELYYENAVQAVPPDVNHTDTFTIERLHVLSVIHSQDLVVATRVDGRQVHQREQMVPPERVERTANFIGENHYYTGDVKTCESYLGDMAELIFFSHAVSPSERAAIEAYLSDRWDVPLR